MKRIRHVNAIASALALALIGGCAMGDFRNTPTMKLCVDYLTFPSYNIWHSARAEELSRRGENCAQYTEAARAKAQSDAAVLNALGAAAAASQPQVVAPPPPRRVVCTTSYGVTTCTER